MDDDPGELTEGGPLGFTDDYYLVFCEVHGTFHQVWFRVYQDGSFTEEDIDA